VLGPRVRVFFRRESVDFGACGLLSAALFVVCSLCAGLARRCLRRFPQMGGIGDGVAPVRSLIAKVRLSLVHVVP